MIVVPGGKKISGPKLEQGEMLVSVADPLW